MAFVGHNAETELDCTDETISNGKRSVNRATGAGARRGWIVFKLAKYAAYQSWKQRQQASLNKIE